MKEAEHQPAGSRWRTDAGLAALVFAVAAGLRVLYWQDLVTVPFFQNLVGDAASYDAWARRIAAGDWWGDRVFYQAPAYPYFLAAVYRLTEPDPWWAHVAQLALGSTTSVLVFLATRLLFDRWAALVAGGIAALLPAALYADGVIQKTSLALFLTAALLAAVAAFSRRPGAVRAGLAGAGLGLLALTRENALALLALIPPWMVLAGRPRRIERRLGAALAFTLATVALLALVALRNWSVGGTFAPTTSQAGTNFYIGNHAGATGSYVPLLAGRGSAEFEASDAARLAERAVGRPLSPGEVSRYWFGEAFSFVREQPAHWLALLVWKGLLVVNAFEIPDTEDIYVYADASPLLRALLRILHFGVIFPLAVLGFGLARREPAARLLALLAAGMAASTVFFFVVARYRLPVVVFLLPLAGVGVARAVEAVRAGDGRRLVGPGVAALLAAAIANLPLLDTSSQRMISYLNLGAIALDAADLEGAERALTRARALGENVDLEVHLGVLRLRQQRLAEAADHARRVIRTAPRDPRGLELLARVRLREGDRAEAARLRAEAARLDRARGGALSDREPPGGLVPAIPGSGADGPGSGRAP